MQAAIAFASGTAFYILRRVTGSLIWAMLLHGLWDVSVFAVGHAPVSTAFGAILAPVVGVLAVVVVYWVITGTDERTAPLETETTPHRRSREDRPVAPVNRGSCCRRPQPDRPVGRCGRLLACHPRSR